MANQMSWREACGAAWNKLTGVDNEGSAAGGLSGPRFFLGPG